LVSGVQDDILEVVQNLCWSKTSTSNPTLLAKGPSEPLGTVFIWMYGILNVCFSSLSLHFLTCHRSQIKAKEQLSVTMVKIP